MEKKCIGCDSNFNVYHLKNKKYCSTKCGQKHRRELLRGSPARPKRTKPLELKHCEQCNKEFKPRDETTKYCSIDCRDKARKVIKDVLIKTKECKNCKKIFEYTNDKKLHCSNECKVEYNRNNIGLQSRKGPVVICEKCGIKFKSWQSNKLSRFCSSECAPHGRKATKPSIKCGVCGVLFRRYGGGYNAKFCSRDCYIKSNPKEKTKEGYVLIYNKEYSNMVSGQVLEHRYIMGIFLGRKLESYETVHHIDGNRSNNNIENLQLRTGNHGKGIVHCCGDCGSINIITKEIS